MWLEQKITRKWHPNAVESRIYAIAEAEAHANGLSESEAAAEAMEAVYRVMSWLQAARSYRDVVEMIKEAYGVDTCQSALNGFWQRFCSPYLGETQRRHARLSTELANIATPEEEARIESQFWKSVRDSAFAAMHSPGANSAEVVHFAKVLIARQKNETDERKVALLEQKAAQLDALKATVESGDDLTPEERLQKIREGLKI